MDRAVEFVTRMELAQTEHPLAQGEAMRSVESQHLETAELRSAPGPLIPNP